MIVDASQTGNPLFLVTLLEELVTTAVFETVQQITEQCLTMHDNFELARLLLVRCVTSTSQG